MILPEPCPSVAPEAPFTPLVLSLLEVLTLEEKLSLIAGDDDPHSLGQAGYLPGVPRLGVPPRRDADGHGVDLDASWVSSVEGDGSPTYETGTTAFPSRIGVAATFDRSAPFAQGEIQGREGRALGIDLLYAPQLDICRLPNFGRNNTTFSEDPYLSGEMGAGEVAGTQSQGLMTTVKHFAMYNGQVGVPFAGRPLVPTKVDDRSMHEIYLTPFETAIEKAQPAGVMAAYQMFQVEPFQQVPNWASGNSHTLTRVLRDQWRYTGFAMSDFGAVHSTDSLLAGLDQQYQNARPGILPGLGGPWFGADLRPFVDPHSSHYSLAYDQALHRAAAHVLYQYERFGLLVGASPDGPVEGATLPARPSMDKEAGIVVTRRLADESIVLLSNRDGILPLAPADLAAGVALIGPTGAQLMVSGLDAERSAGFADRVACSPVQRLREAAPDAAFTYSSGIEWIGEPVPAEAFGPGLLRTSSVGSEPVTDAMIDYPASGGLQPGEGYTWTGTIEVPADSVYSLSIQQSNPVPSRYYGELFGLSQTTIDIDGLPLPLSEPPVPNHTYPAGSVPAGGANHTGSRHLTAGTHTLVVKTVVPGNVTTPTFRLTWSDVTATIAAAARAAAQAAVAIVFVDDNGGPATIDTPTGLNPLADNQTDLIAAVAAANPRTVVVVSSGNVPEMDWFDDVAAVVEAWYPGQEGGAAIASILLGTSNPSGRLPVTVPRSWTDTPFHDHPERYLGRDGAVLYNEGLLVGYRWYDHQQIDPLLPFGFGLSYTTFTLADLDLEPIADGGLLVRFSVTNTGAVAGAAVPQVYVGAPQRDDLPFADRGLAQFARVWLEPGQTTTVQLKVAARAFAHWNSHRQDWERDPGPRRIWVGESSRDLTLAAEVALPA